LPRSYARINNIVIAVVPVIVLVVVVAVMIIVSPLIVDTAVVVPMVVTADRNPCNADTIRV
jgi:hypothetical protein